MFQGVCKNENSKTNKHFWSFVSTQNPIPALLPLQVFDESFNLFSVSNFCFYHLKKLCISVDRKGMCRLWWLIASTNRSTDGMGFLRINRISSQFIIQHFRVSFFSRLSKRQIFISHHHQQQQLRQRNDRDNKSRQ